MVCAKVLNVFVVALLASAGIVDATRHVDVRQAKGDDKTESATKAVAAVTSAPAAATSAPVVVVTKSSEKEVEPTKTPEPVVETKPEPTTAKENPVVVQAAPTTPSAPPPPPAATPTISDVKTSTSAPPPAAPTTESTKPAAPQAPKATESSKVAATKPPVDRNYLTSTFRALAKPTGSVAGITVEIPKATVAPVKQTTRGSDAGDVRAGGWIGGVGVLAGIMALM